MASEGFVWTTASVIIALEYGRQSRKDAEKKRNEQAYRHSLDERASDASATAAATAARAAAEAAAALHARLDAVESRVIKALDAKREALALQLEREERELQGGGGSAATTTTAAAAPAE